MLGGVRLAGHSHHMHAVLPLAAGHPHASPAAIYPAHSQALYTLKAQLDGLPLEAVAPQARAAQLSINDDTLLPLIGEMRCRWCCSNQGDDAAISNAAAQSVTSCRPGIMRPAACSAAAAATGMSVHHHATLPPTLPAPHPLQRMRWTAWRTAGTTAGSAPACPR